jgi:hypothetical protein
MPEIMVVPSGTLETFRSDSAIVLELEGGSEMEEKSLPEGTMSNDREAKILNGSLG